MPRLDNDTRKQSTYSHRSLPDTAPTVRIDPNPMRPLSTALLPAPYWVHCFSLLLRNGSHLALCAALSTRRFASTSALVIRLPGTLAP